MVAELVGKGVVRVPAVRHFGLVAGFLAVHALDFIQRQPHVTDNLFPARRVVLLGKNIRHDRDRVEVGDGHIAPQVLVKLHADVEVAPLLDEAIPPHGFLFAVVAVVNLDMQGHFGEDICYGLTGLALAGLEGDVCAGEYLLADGRLDRRVDAIILDAAALQGVFEVIPVGVGPLAAVAGKIAEIAVGFLDVV